MSVFSYLLKKRVSLLLVLALIVATIISPRLVFAQEQEKMIYVLAVKEAGANWVDKNEMKDAVTGCLKAIGLKYELISSIDDWEALIKEAPENVIIVNCHGELMPIPTSYGDDYVSFYKDLAKLVREKGWIIVQMVGYGFYYIGNSKVETVGSRLTVDDTGGSVFFTAIGLSYGQPDTPDLVNPWCDAEAVLVSDVARNISRVVGIRLPETVWCARGLAIAVDQLAELSPDTKILWYWYETKNKTWQGYPYLAIVALKVGKGIVVWGGLGGGESEKYTALVTAYLVKPELATMKVRVPFMMKRYIFTYSLIALGAAIAAFGIAMLYRRAIPPPETV